MQIQINRKDFTGKTLAEVQVALDSDYQHVIVGFGKKDAIQISKLKNKRYTATYYSGKPTIRRTPKEYLGKEVVNGIVMRSLNGDKGWVEEIDWFEEKVNIAKSIISIVVMTILIATIVYKLLSSWL